MIQIHDISDSSEFREHFIKFGVYCSGLQPDRPPKSEINEAALLDKQTNFFFPDGGKLKSYVALCHGNVVGRIGAMINPKINSGKAKLGFVGLFESIENYQVSKILLDTAVGWLKSEKCNMIWGPMDFSIWHNYRFLIDNFDSKPIFGEPRNPNYYPRFFEKYGFVKAVNWKSYLTDQQETDKVIQNFKPHARIFDLLDYSLLKFDMGKKEKLLETAHQLISKTYTGFVAYSNISKENFLNMYTHLPEVIDSERTVFIINPIGKVIGFILALKDISDLHQIEKGYNESMDKFRIANYYQVGVTKEAIHNAVVKGDKMFGKYFSVFKGALCKSLESLRASGEYSHAIFSLMKEMGPAEKITSQFKAQVRNHALFQLKIN